MSTTAELLEQAREKLKEQDEMLRDLTTMPFELASVVEVLEDSVVVAPLGTSKVIEVNKPKGYKKANIGSIVRLNQVGQILDASPYLSYGAQATIDRVNGDQIYLNTPMGTVTVLRTKVEVKPGDLVMLDPSGQVIVAKLPQETSLVYEGDTGVCWNDIGGHEHAKRELREALEMPYLHAETFKLFSKKPAKGFLLFGPTGNGKTMLAKAAASCLAAVHGAEARRSAFIYVKGPEILSKWVGETEQTIRTLFGHGKEHAKANGFPAVLFIDEADALLGRRGGRTTTSGMEHTLVPQFLSEMDGLDESSVIVILATNRADILDNAIIRPGRIDRKIHIGGPVETEAIEVFQVHLKRIPLAPKETCEGLAKKASEILYHKPFPLYKVQTKAGVMDFTMRDLISGAMIAGMVERAVSKAIHRNIEAKASKPQGLGWPDIEGAIQSVYHEHGLMAHDQELEAFQDLKGTEITGVQRTYAA